jgi:hypothetical protein
LPRRSSISILDAFPPQGRRVADPGGARVSGRALVGAVFFLTVGATLAEVGVTTAFVLGTASALMISAVLLVVNRWRTVR